MFPSETWRVAGPWLAICLLLPASVASGGSAELPDGSAATIELPTTIQRVWARNDSKKRTGDLTVESDRLDFEGGSEKKSFSLSMESIRSLSFGRMGQDVDTDWVVLEVEEAGETRLVGLRDGRKFGFGKETDELFVLLKAAFRKLHVAQYDVKPGLSTYDALDDLFTFAVPSEWTAFDLSRTQIDGLPDLGRLLLTAERIAAGRERKDDTEADLRRFDAGGIRGVFVDRRQPASGMKCGGFSKKARATALDWFREDLRKHGKLTILGGPTVEVTTLGGCQGLRIFALARTSAGGEVEVDHRLVARTEAAVTLGFTIPTEQHDAVRRTVKQIVESFRFSAARSGRGN